jgi:trimethyllysine dioxygenase
MSLFPWEWILRHGKKVGIPISKEEKEMQVDP